MGHASDPEELAVYSIRVSGRLGPLLLSLLCHSWVADMAHRGPETTVSFVADGADLVDLAQRASQQGITIECMRTIDDTGLRTGHRSGG